MKKIVCGCLLLIGSMISAAYADTTYQVEIIVFARDVADGENSLRTSSELQYPAKTIALNTSEGNAPFQALPTTSLVLNREASAIEQRKNMRVLLHQAWLWPGEDAAHATAVAIAAGRQFSSHHELEGYIALSAEHFLQIDTRLWLSRFGSTAENPPNALVLPTVPSANGSAMNSSEAQAAVESHSVEQLFLLREKRRMRSGELHYFDHARLGLLVLVTPLVPAP
jgi:peptidoglycan-binding protein CsiV